MYASFKMCYQATLNYESGEETVFLGLVFYTVQCFNDATLDTRLGRLNRLNHHLHTLAYMNKREKHVCL